MTKNTDDVTDEKNRRLTILESCAFDLLQHVLPEDQLERKGVEETPARYAKALAFWTSGYEVDPSTIIKLFEDGGENYDEMVMVGGTPFYSLCEHHLAPFFGVAHVAYIPSKRGVIGLSKIPRLIDIFARRLQTQERLTQQIAACIQEHLDPIGVAVVMRGRHMCMESRGVQKTGTITMTSHLIGALKDKPEARAEFFKLVDMADRNGGRI